MSTQVLQYRGVVAVCFSCGAEKPTAFGPCIQCNSRPTQEDELTDSLLLSRFCSSDILLSQAVAERSPGLVIKAADRTVVRDVARALRGPQLRQFLSLPLEKRQLDKNSDSSTSVGLEHLVRFAQSELASEQTLSLESCLANNTQHSFWAKSERLIEALRAEAATAPIGVLLESIEELALDSRDVEESDLRQYVARYEGGDLDLTPEKTRALFAEYERSMADRIVVSLERVRTESLITLFQRLRISSDRRRDKQALPLVKGLMDVYQSYAIEILRAEGANAAQLISAIRTDDSVNEEGVIVALVGELEALLANWHKVASPLSGSNADREVSGIRRELQNTLEYLTEHLLTKNGNSRLSERVSRLALELL